MKRELGRWAPAAVLLLGVVMTLAVDGQSPMRLRAALAVTVPAEMDGLPGRDIVISDQELRVAGVTDYLLREFAPRTDAGGGTDGTAGGGDTGGNAAAGGGAMRSSVTEAEAAQSSVTDGEAVRAAAATSGFSVYVGYYDSQTQGKTIHSPKNCLPGSGWEALQSQRVTIDTPTGPIPANRYLLQRGDEQALVVYWYQGRGRVEANEYLVKANLLRDAALRGRTEEALVRIVVPIVTTADAAFEVAARAAATLVPSLDQALPGA